MMSKKDWFVEEFGAIENVRVMATAMELPNGAVELITNYYELHEKVAYILANYDEDLRLNHNQDIRIVSWLFA